MKKDITDIIRIGFNQDKTLEEQAAEPGELVRERDREESLFGQNTSTMAERKRMIAIQEKLVLRMINNGDEEEYQPPPPKKPHLRIVK